MFGLIDFFLTWHQTSNRQFKKNQKGKETRRGEKCTQLQHLALFIVFKGLCSKMYQSEGFFLDGLHKWRWQFKARSNTKEQGSESIVLYFQCLAGSQMVENT